MVFLLIVNKKLIIIYEIFFSNRGQLIVKLQLKMIFKLFFKETKLKIPGSIKSIGDRVFYNNYRNSFVII